MATERDKCGLSSLLPMSCRGRAEAFARRLHSRLRSLNTNDDDNGGLVMVDENSWLTATANHDNLSLVQPRNHQTTVEAEVFIDFGLLESPGSPENEFLDEQELDHHLWNKNNNNEQFRKQLNSVADSRSNDSSDSSDGTFYDTQEFFLHNNTNGCNNLKHVNGYGKPMNGDCQHNENDLVENLKELCIEDQQKITQNGYSSSNNTSNTVDEVDCSKNLICNTNNIVEDFKKHNGVQHDETETDSNEEQEETPRVRRCSSLKTGKTPPGTPGRKKIVRFADALGLDLADVRTFLDEIPKIPISAYEDLTDIDLNEPTTDYTNKTNQYMGVKSDKLLVPLFQQPGNLINFLDLVRDNLVCMENAVVDDPLLFSIKGSVRVRNLDFHKSVHIRYTMDSWRTYVDVQAVYVENSCDGFSDLFTFIIYAHTISVGQRLEFAVRFQCKGCQYWDNNKGVNYCFQCLPATNTTPYAPITHCGDDWGASFYY